MPCRDASCATNGSASPPTGVADDVLAMQLQAQRRMFNLGAKKAFAALFERLRQRVVAARQQGAEALDLLDGSFKQLNSEFGFSLVLAPAPDLSECGRQLDALEQNYVHYLGLSNALRLSDDRFMEPFRRMLLDKLQTAFAGALTDIANWHRSASSQLESQLRDRRETFARRHEALARVGTAQDELESRISDLEDQDQRLQALALHTRDLAQSLLQAAKQLPRELASSDAQDAAATQPGLQPLAVPKTVVASVVGGLSSPPPAPGPCTSTPPGWPAKSADPVSDALPARRPGSP